MLSLTCILLMWKTHHSSCNVFGITHSYAPGEILVLQQQDCDPCTLSLYLGTTSSNSKNLSYHFHDGLSESPPLDVFRDKVYSFVFIK